MENRFAAARRRYLRTHMDGIYTGMLLTGTLVSSRRSPAQSANTPAIDLCVFMRDGMGRTDEQYPQPRGGGCLF